MKTAVRTILGGVLFMALTALQAAETLHPLNDYLQVDNKAIQVVKSGESVPLQKEMTLPNGYIVHTNGTLELKGGVEKKLNPGQQITLDGLYMAKDGRFLQIPDHYLVDKGKTTFIHDGQASPVPGEVTFKNGSLITADDWWVQPNGLRKRLLDGQILDASGNPLPAQDFVLNRGGQITLQMQGTLIPLERNRFMTMNNGTRVYGDGRILPTNGTEFMLPPGQRLNLPGIVLTR